MPSRCPMIRRFSGKDTPRHRQSGVHLLLNNAISEMFDIRHHRRIGARRSHCFLRIVDFSFLGSANPNLSFRAADFGGRRRSDFHVIAARRDSPPIGRPLGITRRNPRMPADRNILSVYESSRSGLPSFRRAFRLDFLPEPTQPYPESGSQLLGHADAHLHLTPLDQNHVSPVDSHLLGEGLLRKTLHLAASPHKFDRAGFLSLFFFLPRSPHKLRFARRPPPSSRANASPPPLTPTIALNAQQVPLLHMS
jgi:hypothetical protein